MAVAGRQAAVSVGTVRDRGDTRKDEHKVQRRGELGEWPWCLSQ